MHPPHTVAPRPRAPVSFLSLSLALLFVAPLAATERDCLPLPSKPDPELTAAVDPIVDEAVADGFAGGVAILREGAMVYHRVAGHADRRGKVPVTTSTRFHVASITKYLTAILTLRTATSARIGLSQAIAPLVPGTRLAERSVTWLDLLAHTSGLGSSYAAERIHDPDAAVTAIDDLPIDRERVGSFRYANDGYDLLAILLERVHGSTFEDAMRTQVLAPACLENTSFWGDTGLSDPRRVGQPLEKVSRRLRVRNYGMLGSAGMLTTAHDLVRLAHTIERGRLLDPDAVETLRAPRGAMSLGQATLGAFLVDHPVLGRVLTARGYEDWGDNAILNHYLEHGVIVAVVTSKGPAESTGAPPFRTRISEAIEGILVRDRP